MATLDELADQYRKLLDEESGEQVYQKFIEEHTCFIPRDFVQNHGVHLSLVLRKLSFGADYKTDFFFLSKSSDDWNAVSIELEKPGSKFFKAASNDFHSDFNNALQQINRWRAWLSDVPNQQTVLNALQAIRVPSTMRSNPTRYKFVLVHGRRSEYEGNQIRRSLIAAQERDDFKIVTFDSLAESLKQKSDLYVGVRRNEVIEIQGNEIVDQELFTWVDPTMLSVNDVLLSKLKERVANAKPTKFGRRIGDIHENAARVRSIGGAATPKE